MKTKILIFGNTGFIGSAIENYFKEDQNFEVHGASLTNNVNPVDITDINSISKINIRPDIVINSASVLPKNDALANPFYIDNVFKVNVLGASNIANWSKNVGVKKLFNLSTLVVNKKPWKRNLKESDYELPSGSHIAYCMSKISQERIITEILSDSETFCTNIRLSAVYGEGMKKEGVLFSLYDKAIKNDTIVLTNGLKTYFDFIYVKDIPFIISKLINSNEHFDTINLASGEEISLINLANMIKFITNSSSKIENIENNREPSYAVINTDIIVSLFRGNLKLTPLETGLKRLFAK